MTGRDGGMSPIPFFIVTFGIISTQAIGSFCNVSSKFCYANNKVLDILITSPDRTDDKGTNIAMDVFWFKKREYPAPPSRKMCEDAPRRSLYLNYFLE